MELDPGPMANDNHSKSKDPEDCDTGTLCYDLVPSYLVPSDHVISAFQQGHQAFPLVKLKDSITNLDKWEHPRELNLKLTAMVTSLEKHIPKDSDRRWI